MYKKNKNMHNIFLYYYTNQYLQFLLNFYYKNNFTTEKINASM